MIASVAFVVQLVGVISQPPLDLSAAEEHARRYHPAAKAAGLEVSAVTSYSLGLLAPYAPLVSFNWVGSAGSGTMLFPSSVMPFSYPVAEGRSHGTLNTTFMWRPFSFGRDAAARELGREAVASSIASLRDTVLDVVLEVRVAFAEALRAREVVQARRQALDAAREVERITREGFDAGKLPEAFVFRAAADTAEAERELALAEAEANAALAVLRERIGLAQSERLELGSWDLELSTPESLRSALQEVPKRPDLAALDHAVRKEERRSQLAALSRKPDVGLMAMGEWMSASGMSSEVAIRVGLVVSIPLMDGGERRAMQKEAESQAEKLRAELRMKALRGEAEVASAWSVWEAVPFVLRAARARLEAARESYRVALVRYQEGKAVLTEVTDSRSQLMAAIAGMAEAEALERVAWSKLQRAMGKG